MIEAGSPTQALGGVRDLTVAAAAGVGLAAFYFSALWLTVRRLPEVERPALWLSASLLGRLAVVLTGFVLLARSGVWPAPVIALVAFMLTRRALVRRVGAGASRPKEGAT